MMVLDGLNSTLDAINDVVLARTLQHTKENKITVITITQRPALLQSVDNICCWSTERSLCSVSGRACPKKLSQHRLSIKGRSFGQQIP